MKRTRRLIAMLVLLFAVVAVWLVATNSGLRLLVARLLPPDGSVRIGTVQGSLWSGVVAEHIVITREGMRLTIAHAKADAALPSLVRGALRLNHVELRSVRLKLLDRPASQESPAPPPMLPDLAIAALTAIDLEVRRGDEHWQIDRVETRVAMRAHTLSLDALKLRSPTTRIDGALAFDLARALPLYSAQLGFATRVGADEWQGVLSADTKKSATGLTLALQQPLRATLTMTDVLGANQWSAELAVPEQAWHETTPVAALLKAQALDGDIKVTGTAQYATWQAVALDVTAKLAPDALIFSPSTLDLAAPKGRIEFSGRLPIAAETALDLKLQTEALIVANPEAPPLTISGDVAVSGARVALQIQPTLKLVRSGWPAASVRGVVVQRDGQWQAEDLQLTSGASLLQLDGVLATAANPANALRLQLSRFDPALLQPEWPGAIDAELLWRGAWIGGEAVGVLQIERLAGELRGRDLRGQGQIELVTHALAATQLELDIGATTLRLARSDASAQFEFLLQSPNLDDLVPGWRGSLALSAAGDKTWQGEFDATGVEMGGLAMAHAHAKASFGADAQAPLTVNATFAGLVVGERRVEQLRVDLDGTRGAHRIDVDAQFGLRQIQFGANGALNSDNLWQGQLQALDVLTPEVRASLHAPAALTLGDGRIALARTCLHDANDGRACFSIEHADAGGRGTLEVVALDLRPLLAILLPQERFAARARLSGAADAEWRGARVVAANARFESADGDLLVAERPDLDLGFRDLMIDAHIDAGQGTWSASAALKPEGRAESSGQLAFVDGEWQYDGQLRLDLHRFDLVEAFTSQFAAPRGDMSGEFQFRGRGAEAPRWSGAFAVTGFAAELPELGLELSDGALAIVAVPTGIIVRGAITSGGGQLILDGGRGVENDAPWHFSLTGENAVLSDTPALRLVLSPALTLKQEERVWKLAGRVSIPEARIDAAAMAPPDASSSDVVIVDDLDADDADARTRWQADVTLAFGEKARLIGYGFDGRVRGDLRLRQRSGDNATGQGQLQVSGKYAAYGQRLTIRRGRLLFANSPLDEPTLDIEAERKAGSAVAGVRVTGSAMRPQTEIYSRPSLPESEALALLVTGRNIRNVSGADRQRLSSAALALGTIGGDLLANNLGAEIGITGDAARGTEAFTIGKYLTPKLFVGYGLGLVRRGQVLIVRYLIRDDVELEVTSGEESRASLNYVIER